MTAFLLPVLGGLHGWALLRWLRAPLPWPARLGASLVAGPCVSTLLLLLALQCGLPHARGAVLAVLGLACLPAFIGPRLRGPGMRVRNALPPLLVALGVAALVLLRVLETPTPEGDGLFNFALKARAIFVLGDPWPFLRTSGLEVVHPDYPLHVPLLMDLGYVLNGGPTGLAALAGGLLVLPGLVLFLGGLSGARSAWRGALVALLCAGSEALWTYAWCGYADLPLAALFAVAALTGCAGERPGLAAGVLAGLLPWVKLEGLALGLLLICVLTLRGLRRRRPPWAFLAAGLLLLPLWPALLWIEGVQVSLAEGLAPADFLTRAGDILRGFGEHLADPRGPCGLLLPAVLLAAPCALRSRSLEAPRTAALLVLLVLAGAPLLVALRGTASMHLEGGDVPVRLLLQALPLGLHVIAGSLAAPVPKRSSVVAASGADRMQ